MNEEQEFLVKKLAAAIDLVYRENPPLLQYFVRNEEQEALVEKLRATIQSVYGDDEFAGDLWSDRTGMEQAFVFRTGLYLYKLLRGTEYESLDLDSEYNKSYGDPKRTKNFPIGVRPDLILHRRNSNSKNKLVVEFKGYWDKGLDKDVLKLMDLTNPEDSYQYTVGVLVIIGKKNAEFKLFVAGQKVEEN